jgi:hypothetical protein
MSSSFVDAMENIVECSAKNGCIFASLSYDDEVTPSEPITG